MPTKPIIAKSTGRPPAYPARWSPALRAARAARPHNESHLHPHVCTCGLTIKQRNPVRHLRGVIHKNARRVRTLLSTPCISYREIARRLGISFQYVSRIAGLLGHSGDQRVDVCVATGRELDLAISDIQRERFITRHASIYRACETLGLGVTILETGRNPLLEINGYRCQVTRTHYAHKAPSMSRFAVCKITDPNADFHIAQVFTGDWYILPIADFPVLKNPITMFSLHMHTNRSSVSRRRKNWADHKNAWPLLATPKRSA